MLVCALASPPPPTASLAPPSHPARMPAIETRARTGRQRNAVLMSIDGLPVRNLSDLGPVSAERQLELQENSRTPEPDRTRVGESATTVHEGIAPRNATCHTHGGKPNRNRWCRHRSRGRTRRARRLTGASNG